MNKSAMLSGSRVNMQTIEREGITLFVFQYRKFERTYVFAYGKYGVVFIKSGDNVQKEVAMAFRKIREGLLVPFEGPQKDELKREIAELAAWHHQKSTVKNR